MTRRFFITKNLDILEFESTNEWGYAKHKHNFFELTFILKGTGQHILNKNIIDYKKGDVFFLTPKDEHEFVITTPTKFGILKFTEQLYLERIHAITDSHWQKHLETVIFHSNIIPENIIKFKKDQRQLYRLFKIIKTEFNNDTQSSRNILLELFGALLIILSRNLEASLQGASKTPVPEEEKIEKILTYIRLNVLNKERIKIKTIADKFFMSPNYVSIFIKKHAGISIQQYIIQTKIKMAERLLKQTNLNISEVAEKTGFTDASHFNKIFKKYNGVNPSEFVSND